MSALNAEQRGDLAEEMLPKAALLSVLVHGDGGPEDVAEVLAGLDDRQKNALIVVLAGMVDPEQPVGKALGWLDFNEHGALTVPASWSQSGLVRDLAPEPAVPDDGEYVDQVAVAHFAQGLPGEVNDEEFLQGVQQCARRGLNLVDVDRLHGWERKTTETRVNRIKKRYQRSGRVFPELGLAKPRVFSEADVVTIRERSFEGATDIALALSYGTSSSAIGAICRGRSYQQYGGPLREPKRKPSRNTQAIWNQSAPGFLEAAS
jgi:hypothetical protein